MRLVLTMLAFGCSAIAAQAQTDGFNPYQAVIEGMSLAEAEPLIAAAYGAAEDTTAHLGEDFIGSDVTILSARDGNDNLSAFLFCDDRLAAVSALVTPIVAAEVLAPLSLPSGPGLVVNPSEQGVMITAAEPDINLAYWGVGTKASYVSLSYPWEVFVNLDFAGRCEDVAAN